MKNTIKKLLLVTGIGLMTGFVSTSHAQVFVQFASCIDARHVAQDQFPMHFTVQASIPYCMRRMPQPMNISVDKPGIFCAPAQLIESTHWSTGDPLCGRTPASFIFSFGGRGGSVMVNIRRDPNIMDYVGYGAVKVFLCQGDNTCRNGSAIGLNGETVYLVADISR